MIKKISDENRKREEKYKILNFVGHFPLLLMLLLYFKFLNFIVIQAWRKNTRESKGIDSTLQSKGRQGKEVVKHNNKGHTLGITSHLFSFQFLDQEVVVIVHIHLLMDIPLNREVLTLELCSTSQPAGLTDFEQMIQQAPNCTYCFYLTKQ